MRCGLVLIFVCGVMTGPAWGQAPASGPAPGDLDGVNPRWLEPMERNIQEQISLLVAAYSLDERQEEYLRAEMQRRLVEQVPIERRYQKDKLTWAREAKRRIRAGAGRDGAEADRREFMLEMKQRLEEMPLNEKQVAAWVESQLSPEQAKAGRVRLEELWQRRKSHRDAFIVDSGMKSGAKARSVEALKAETAALSEAGKPLPGGRKQATALAGEAKKTDLARPVEPNKAVAPVAEAPKALLKIDTTQPRSLERGGEKPAGTTKPAEPPKQLAPAPPLDEWDKHVAAVARKYGFTEVQITKARAILAEMKSRAGQYRLSRADAYAKADSTADPKDRSERLQRLNSTIDAFFEELKARLEALPTSEQKQRAKAGVG